VGHRAGLDVAENIAPTGIRYPDRQACTGSLYRLSYPGPRGGKGMEYIANFCKFSVLPVIGQRSYAFWARPFGREAVLGLQHPLRK